MHNTWDTSHTIPCSHTHVHVVPGCVGGVVLVVEGVVVENNDHGSPPLLAVTAS